MGTTKNFVDSWPTARAGRRPPSTGSPRRGLTIDQGRPALHGVGWLSITIDPLITAGAAHQRRSMGSPPRGSEIRLAFADQRGAREQLQVELVGVLSFNVQQ